MIDFARRSREEVGGCGNRDSRINFENRSVKSPDTPGPCLCRGQLWTRKRVIAALGVGDATFSSWVAAGLRRLGPNTKEDYFLSDHIIEFMISAPENLPKFEAKYKTKKRK